MSRHAFGVALRRHRERLQLTQEALAHRSGISVRTVRDLETGRVRRPHGASVRLLADALELSGESSAEFNALALSETAAPPAAQRLVPRQLPADIGGFAGRSAALASLDGNLRAVTEAGHSATVISSIAGMAGIGKTALAVHWAHRVASEFPDGQLYVDLRGHSRSAPMPAIEALARFLRALGVLADQVPVEVDEAAALYRSLLAGRRVLVILDNAASAVQVRPLLPGGSASFVLITSRVWLAGLIAIEGANAIRLGVLPPNESAELLSRLIGPDRTAEEPQAATRLACLCAHLPLALRIAAANLSGDPYSSIAQVVVELAAGNRLDALQVAGEDQPAVLAAFDLSYQTLPLEARRLFGRFGVAPGTEFSADAAAALAGVDPPQAAATVNALVTVHLVEQIAPGRYGLHELLRIYARERALAEDPDWTAAVQRLYDWYLAGADAAARRRCSAMNRLDVPAAVRAQESAFTADAAALSWLDAARHNLVAAVVQASDGDWQRSRWLLADAVRGYFWFQGSPRESVAVAEAAMKPADDEGDVGSRAATRMAAAMAQFRIRDIPRAADRLTSRSN